MKVTAEFNLPEDDHHYYCFYNSLEMYDRLVEIYNMVRRFRKDNGDIPDHVYKLLDDVLEMSSLEF